MCDGIASSAFDIFGPATAMLRLLRERRIPAADLLDFHLRRIDRYNARLNAIIIRNDEDARHAAAAADAARARDEDGALLGLPVTIKDCLDVRGLPTTAGVPERAAATAETDAPLASLDAGPGEDGAFWVQFLHGLVAPQPQWRPPRDHGARHTVRDETPVTLLVSLQWS